MDTVMNQFTWVSLGAVVTSVVAAVGVLYTWIVAKQARNAADVARLTVEREYYERSLRDLADQMARDQSRWADMNHLILDSLRAQSSRPAQTLVEDSGLGPQSFLEGLGLRLSELKVDRQQIFILTPFAKQYEQEYLEISSACQEVGLVPRRGNEVSISGNILPHIVRGIAKSRFVIANINGRNPNVFYELGIAQAMGKPALIVSRDLSRVPFDLKQQQLVLYRDLDDLRHKLKDSMLRLLANTETAN